MPQHLRVIQPCDIRPIHAKHRTPGSHTLCVRCMHGGGEIKTEGGEKKKKKKELAKSGAGAILALHCTHTHHQACARYHNDAHTAQLPAYCSSIWRACTAVRSRFVFSHASLRTCARAGPAPTDLTTTRSMPGEHEGS